MRPWPQWKPVTTRRGAGQSCQQSIVSFGLYGLYGSPIEVYELEDHHCTVVPPTALERPKSGQTDPRPQGWTFSVESAWNNCHRGPFVDPKAHLSSPGSSPYYEVDA
jgi:hypothetical protein